MTDVIIILNSVIAFVLYILTLALMVRKKGHFEIFKSIKTSFFLLLCGSSIIIWYLLSFENTNVKVVSLFSHAVLFGGLSFTYTLILFGTSLTSLSIQFLLTLFGHGKRGATLRTLMVEYSKESIVRIRLLRLESSGEIIKRGKKYSIRSDWSYLMLHNKFLLILLKLYLPLDRIK